MVGVLAIAIDFYNNGFNVKGDCLPHTDSHLQINGELPLFQLQHLDDVFNLKNIVPDSLHGKEIVLIVKPYLNDEDANQWLIVTQCKTKRVNEQLYLHGKNCIQLKM
jgi:hypothetical protein